MSKKWKMTTKYNEAVNIVRRLKEKGYEAFFVGGWVRDKLLHEMKYNTPNGLPENIKDWNAIDFTNIPREARDEAWEEYQNKLNNETDIDIATSCLIQDIPKIFDDAIYVGQAFGVCIVKVRSDNKYYQYDLATFRWDGVYEDGRHPSIIKTATVEEDAKRRDFTINAMYYDPIEDKYLDFVGGQEDLKNGVIRAVGDPCERFKEDKLRMLRAVRLQFQLNKNDNEMMSLDFEIEEKTRQAIKDLASELLPAVSYERIWQELDKMSKCIRFGQCLEELKDLGLLSQFLPEATERKVEFWDDEVNCVLELLPLNTPTLIKIMALLGTFEKEEVMKIVKRFNLPKPNWLE